jgi:hypothetical protein
MQHTSAAHREPLTTVRNAVLEMTVVNGGKEKEA